MDDIDRLVLATVHFLVIFKPLATPEDILFNDLNPKTMPNDLFGVKKSGLDVDFGSKNGIMPLH